MTDLKGWTPKSPPDLKPARGVYVAIEPAQFPEAAEELFPAICGPENDAFWTHVPIGPFGAATQFSAEMKRAGDAGGWRTHLLRDARSGAALGMASYMRIRPDHGSAEVGCIVYSKMLQRTPAATEAMYLMAKHVFDDLGYRRYEWKCDNANEASKRAALRLGFIFEGVFRQDMVMKGANRDTAWFSITDREWPRVRGALEQWLAPENFNAEGEQRETLSRLRNSTVK